MLPPTCSTAAVQADENPGTAAVVHEEDDDKVLLQVAWRAYWYVGHHALLIRILMQHA